MNQSSFAATSTYRKEGYKLQAGLTSLTSQQDDSDQESRQTARLRFDRFVSPKLFQFLITSFEHNDRQRLNFRTTLGGGLGKTLVKTKKTELSLLGGVVFTTERFRADEATGDPAELIRSGEGLAGIEWETRLIDRVRLTSKFAVLPGLTQEGRYRLEYDATLRIPLVRNLTWNVTVFDRFDSKPPTEVPRNDFGMVSGLGIVF